METKRDLNPYTFINLPLHSGSLWTCTSSYPNCAKSYPTFQQTPRKECKGEVTKRTGSIWCMPLPQTPPFFPLPNPAAALLVLVSPGRSSDRLLVLVLLSEPVENKCIPSLYDSPSGISSLLLTFSMLNRSSSLNVSS